jgi:hypothetical protein
MIDQRLSGSLGRFLQRRAIQNLKNPTPKNQHPPLSWYFKVRFKFALRKRSFVIRCGVFGLEFYWGAVVPLWNNVSIDEKRYGVIVYPLFRIFPGASIRCFKWLIKSETRDNVGGVEMNECPVCCERKIEEDRLESERKDARAAADKDREMMKKWRKYIQDLPPHRRFTFDVFEDGKLTAFWASADTETEEQAREKLNKCIEDNGRGITLGKLRYNEPRPKHLMEQNFLEDKEHLEKAGIPEYKKPEITFLYGRPQG